MATACIARPPHGMAERRYPGRDACGSKGKRPARPDEPQSAARDAVGCAPKPRRAGAARRPLGAGGRRAAGPARARPAGCRAPPPAGPPGLGRGGGLPAPAVGERLGRLERAGVIAGYRPELDPRALGYELAAVLRIRPAPRQIAAVAELARDTPQVVECHRITGEDCFIMKLHVRTVEHLEEVIDRFTPYGQTTTSIVQSSPVPARGVPL